MVTAAAVRVRVGVGGERGRVKRPHLVKDRGEPGDLYDLDVVRWGELNGQGVREPPSSVDHDEGANGRVVAAIDAVVVDRADITKVA